MNNAIQINNITKTTNLLKISRTHNNYGLIGLALIIIIQIGLWYANLWHPIILGGLLVFCIVWIKYTKEYGKLLTNTNKKMLKLIINSHFSNASYRPKKHILKKCFLTSGLYNSISYIIKGNNLLKGEGWFISNIQASLPKSKTKNQIIVFDGIFTKIKMQNKINGNIVIKPLSVNEKAIIPEILQNLIHRYYTPKVNSTKIGNEIFDEKFEVFASDSSTQSEVITKKLIKSILDIDETINYFFGKEYNGIELSFINNYIFIGVKGIKLYNSNDSFDADTAQKHIEIIKQITNLNNQ